MDQLFKKAFFFTDIHFGRQSNSAVALNDNLEFLKWSIDEAKTRGADVCIFGGDWHDNRHSLHVSTLRASVDGLQLLNDAFERTYFLPGNHDLFYRERRDVASIEFARLFPNITLIREPTTIGGVTFLPWLIGEEHKKVGEMKGRYTFAHLEMPGFLMNAKVEMPDTPNAVHKEDFRGQEYVFSGHFHMRQRKDNIVYTGNVMPFDFSDNWHEDRGMMLLEWGRDPEFFAWPDQPLFRTMKLSEVLENEAKLLKPKLTARITLDIEISYEEATVIRDTFVQRYALRKMELIQQSAQPEQNEFNTEVAFQSVDQIVIDGLMSMTGNGVKSEVLVELYKSLPSL
jgi:hypothetical protein